LLQPPPLHCLNHNNNIIINTIININIIIIQQQQQPSPPPPPPPNNQHTAATSLSNRSIAAYSRDLCLWFGADRSQLRHAASENVAKTSYKKKTSKACIDIITITTTNTIY
jgi:hypothetical protein